LRPRPATTNGIDIVFENVGGMVLDAALSRMNAFGRVALCGVIAGYNSQPIPIQNVRSILVNRMLIQGFIITDHIELWPQALAELVQHVAAKQSATARRWQRGYRARPARLSDCSRARIWASNS
jgi:NADPH-dependent curcumin reductase